MRLLALATLGLWLSALTASMACGPVEAAAGKEVTQACCGADTCAGPRHSETGSSSLPLCPPSDSSCVTLKTATFSGPTQALPSPGLQLLYLLPLVALVPDAGLDPVVAAVFHRARLRDWTFTPEVSLGPACRSHAPPVLA